MYSIPFLISIFIEALKKSYDTCFILLFVAWQEFASLNFWLLLNISYNYTSWTVNIVWYYTITKIRTLYHKMIKIKMNLLKIESNEYLTDNNVRNFVLLLDNLTDWQKMLKTVYSNLTTIWKNLSLQTIQFNKHRGNMLYLYLIVISSSKSGAHQVSRFKSIR